MKYVLVSGGMDFSGGPWKFLVDISLGVISGIGKGIIGMDSSLSISKPLMMLASLVHRSLIEDYWFESFVDQSRPIHECRCGHHGAHRTWGGVCVG